MWKPLPNIHVLKFLKGSSKEKTQKRQYLIVVGLVYNNQIYDFYAKFKIKIERLKNLERCDKKGGEKRCDGKICDGRTAKMGAN